MSKSYKQIIDETVEYYQNHDRAIERYPNGDVKGCRYYMDGEMCAVGRCLVDPVKVNNSNVCNDYVDMVVNYFGPDVFQEDYRGKSVMFWRDLQQLHDDDINWNGRELTEAGIAYVKLLHENND